MIHKYSAPPPSHSTSAQNSNGRSRPTKTPAVSTVRITTDWKATTLTSQAPLRPSAKLGLSGLAGSTASNPQVVTHQSAAAAIQTTAAILAASICNTSSVPNTAVAATVVKKPTPRLWLWMSAANARG